MQKREDEVKEKEMQMEKEREQWMEDKKKLEQEHQGKLQETRKLYNTLVGLGQTAAAEQLKLLFPELGKQPVIPTNKGDEF